MAQPLTAGPVHRPFRFGFVRLFCAVAVRTILRVRVEGREHFASGPAIYCTNHLNWADPLVLLAVLPGKPRFAMFGPKEADMAKGGRNRLIVWAGFAVPYRPEKSDLLETTRRVQRVLEHGWIIVIMGEGRIHRGERELTPLADGTAYFGLRSGVPIVPIAINGTSWLGFRRTVRIRVGAPIVANGRASREAIAALTARTEEALLGLVADHPDLPTPGPFGRWLTEVFNDWPEGARPALGDGDGAGTDLASRRARVAQPAPEGERGPVIVAPETAAGRAPESSASRGAGVASCRRPPHAQENPWEPPASQPTPTSTVPGSRSSPTRRSTRGPRS